jgi:hypothetical protein
MRNLILGLSLSVAFIVGALAGPTFMSRTTAAPRRASITKWEHKCINENDISKVQKKGNRLGRVGYEMVASSSIAHTYSYFCFKRRLP